MPGERGAAGGPGGKGEKVSSGKIYLFTFNNNYCFSYMFSVTSHDEDRVGVLEDCI